MADSDDELAKRLLPCPFCGTAPHLDDLSVDANSHFVHCPKCEIQQIANYTAESAIDLWNTRAATRLTAPTDAQPVEDAELVRLLRQTAWCNCSLGATVIDSTRHSHHCPFWIHHEAASAIERLTPPAREGVSDAVYTGHPSHVTRSSDASSFDEVCVICGATDKAGNGWGDLAKPCSKAPAATAADAEARGTGK